MTGTAPSADGSTGGNESEYGLLKDFVIQVTGLSFLGERGNDFALRRALQLRMKATQATSIGAYFADISQTRDTEELRELIDEVTIGETHFFRDQGIFDALREVILPQILARRIQHRTIGIWSAGCSIGPEPYSLSILLRQAFPDAAEAWSIRIIGTDINRRFLRLAREARYNAWALRSVSDPMKAACFTMEDGHWVLKDEYRQDVSFREHNLVADPAPAFGHEGPGLDLILCRNVAIYFDSATMIRLLERFHAALDAGGWLVLGHAEVTPSVVDALDGFDSIHTPGGIVYRKDAPDLPRRRAAPVSRPASAAASRPAPLASAAKIRPVPAPRPRPAAARPGAAPAPAPAPAPAQGRAARAPSVPPSAAGAPTAKPRSAASRPLRELVDAGRWTEVAEGCRDRLDQAPTDSEAYHYQGIAMSHLGRHEEAISSYRRSIYLDRQNPLPHYMLATLLKDCGRPDEARREFRAVAKKLDSRDPDEAVCEGATVTVGELYAVIALWLNEAPDLPPRRRSGR